MRSESDIFQLLQTDRELSEDVRRHLVATLFASPASLTLGAVAGGAAGISAASISSDPLTFAVGLAIPLVGLARILQTVLLARRGGERAAPHAEVQYEIGAWLFSGLLGLLAFLALTRTSHGSLHLLTSCVAIGYAAGICARNAGRPAIALGQLILVTGPLTAALALSDDATLWMLAIVTVLFVLGMSDVTRRTYVAFQTAAAESRARERALREQLEHLPNMIWTADETGQITFWSAHWKEFTGVDPEGLDVGLLLVHRADLPKLRAAWQRSITSGSSFEAAFRLRHRSGDYRWMLSRGRPRKDEDGRLCGWCGACADIHDYRVEPA